MDLNIKKDLTSSWFKLLQDMFCKDISDLEKNKVKFKTTTWKRNKKKMKVEVNIGYFLMEKYLTRLV